MVLLIVLELAELVRFLWLFEVGVLEVGVGGPCISWLTVGIVLAVCCFVRVELLLGFKVWYFWPTSCGVVDAVGDLFTFSDLASDGDGV